MALYTIIRVYEVPAENQQEATDRMMKALWLRVERNFHARDIIREPGAKPGTGKAVSLNAARQQSWPASDTWDGRFGRPKGGRSPTVGRPNRRRGFHPLLGSQRVCGQHRNLSQEEDRCA